MGLAEQQLINLSLTAPEERDWVARREPGMEADPVSPGINQYSITQGLPF